MKATYLKVWAALMALLAATVGAYYLPMGPFNVAAALGIAAAKTFLVVAFFMHARQEQRIVWVWAGVGFYWLGILLVLSQSDYLTRGWD
jgi:cytochrome c oxidase subunit 4